MDEQEALKVLRERKKAIQPSDQLVQELDALTIAIKAMEKATPKQAIKMPEGSYICPSCMIHLKGWTYCTRCGQRIKF